MGTLFAYVAVLIHVVLHEFGHVAAMRETGIRVVEAGIGWDLPPTKVFTTRSGFRWRISPWLVGAYVRPHPDDWAKMSAGPYSQAAWQFNSGIVINLAWALGALGAASMLRGHLTAACAVATVSALVVWARRQVAAYLIPAVGPLALLFCAWGLIRSIGRGDTLGITGVAAAGIAPSDLSFISALEVFAAIGFVMAIINAAPLMPLDNGHVTHRLLRRWAGDRFADRYMKVGVITIIVLAGFALLTDVINMVS